MQLSTAIDKFLLNCRHTKNLSENTLLAYKIDLDEFKTFAKEAKYIHDCTRQLIQNYLRYLFEIRELKGTTVKRRIACLKSMFSWLEEEICLKKILFIDFHSK